MSNIKKESSKEEDSDYTMKSRRLPAYCFNITDFKYCGSVDMNTINTKADESIRWMDNPERTKTEKRSKKRVCLVYRANFTEFWKIWPKSRVIILYYILEVIVLV